MEKDVSSSVAPASIAVPTACLGTHPFHGPPELPSVRDMSSVPALEMQSFLGQFFAPELPPAPETPVDSQAPLVPEFQSVTKHPSVSAVTAAAEMEWGAAVLTLHTPKLEDVELLSEFAPR